MNTRTNIGKRIAELREQQNLSQRELARRCNIDQAHISRIERGLLSPSLDTLAEIAETLDAKVELVPCAQRFPR